MLNYGWLYDGQEFWWWSSNALPMDFGKTWVGCGSPCCGSATMPGPFVKGQNSGAPEPPVLWGSSPKPIDVLTVMFYLSSLRCNNVRPLLRFQHPRIWKVWFFQSWKGLSVCLKCKALERRWWMPDTATRAGLSQLLLPIWDIGDVPASEVMLCVSICFLLLLLVLLLYAVYTCFPGSFHYSGFGLPTFPTDQPVCPNLALCSTTLEMQCQA